MIAGHVRPDGDCIPICGIAEIYKNYQEGSICLYRNSSGSF